MSGMKGLLLQRGLFIFTEVAKVMNVYSSHLIGYVCEFILGKREGGLLSTQGDSRSGILKKWTAEGPQQGRSLRGGSRPLYSINFDRVLHLEDKHMETKVAILLDCPFDVLSSVSGQAVCVC